MSTYMHQDVYKEAMWQSMQLQLESKALCLPTDRDMLKPLGMAKAVSRLHHIPPVISGYQGVEEDTEATVQTRAIGTIHLMETSQLVTIRCSRSFTHTHTYNLHTHTMKHT